MTRGTTLVADSLSLFPQVSTTHQSTVFMPSCLITVHKSDYAY